MIRGFDFTSLYNYCLRGELEDVEMFLFDLKEKGQKSVDILYNDALLLSAAIGSKNPELVSFLIKYYEKENISTLKEDDFIGRKLAEKNLSDAVSQILEDEENPEKNIFLDKTIKEALGKYVTDDDDSDTDSRCDDFEEDEKDSFHFQEFEGDKDHDYHEEHSDRTSILTNSSAILDLHHSDRASAATGSFSDDVHHYDTDGDVHENTHQPVGDIKAQEKEHFEHDSSSLGDIAHHSDTNADM